MFPSKRKESEEDSSKSSGVVKSPSKSSGSKSSGVVKSPSKSSGVVKSPSKSSGVVKSPSKSSGVVKSPSKSSVKSTQKSPCRSPINSIPKGVVKSIIEAFCSPQNTSRVSPVQSPEDSTEGTSRNVEELNISGPINVEESKILSPGVKYKTVGKAEESKNADSIPTNTVGFKDQESSVGQQPDPTAEGEPPAELDDPPSTSSSSSGTSLPTVVELPMKHYFSDVGQLKSFLQSFELPGDKKLLVLPRNHKCITGYIRQFPNGHPEYVLKYYAQNNANLYDFLSAKDEKEMDYPIYSKCPLCEENIPRPVPSGKYAEDCTRL